MTTGEVLYLALVLVTFIGFAAMLAILSRHQDNVRQPRVSISANPMQGMTQPE